MSLQVVTGDSWAIAALCVSLLHLLICVALHVTFYIYVLTGSHRRLMGQWCDQELVPWAEILKKSSPHMDTRTRVEVLRSHPANPQQ